MHFAVELDPVVLMSLGSVGIGGQAVGGAADGDAANVVVGEQLALVVQFRRNPRVGSLGHLHVAITDGRYRFARRRAIIEGASPDLR
jgi:hypothetical protein